MLVVIPKLILPPPTNNMNFLEQLQSTHGDQVAQQLTSRFGLDPAKAAQVLPRMAPFVLGGVQAKMKDEMDEESADAVLGQHGNEDALEDLHGHFERSHQNQASNPKDVLGGLFGQQAPQAQTAMAQQLGVSPDMISKILPVIAPLILGAVMNKMKSGRGLPNTGATAPGGGGTMDILGTILGQQGGGSGGNILGSVLGSVMGGGGQGGGLAQKAGCLSSILGGLLGGRK